MCDGRAHFSREFSGALAQRNFHGGHMSLLAGGRPQLVTYRWTKGRPSRPISYNKIEPIDRFLTNPKRTKSPTVTATLVNAHEMKILKRFQYIPIKLYQHYFLNAFNIKLYQHYSQDDQPLCGNSRPISKFLHRPTSKSHHDTSA